jgi:Family of unknown function (DUF5953)
MARDTFLLIAYTPALSSEDDRPLAVVHAMERALPGLHLSWTISNEGNFIPVQEHARGTASRTNGRYLLLCNGNEEHFVTMFRLETPALLNPGGRAQFEVHAKWPLDAAGIAAADDVLEVIAEGARSYWAHATPRKAAGDIVEQTSPTLAGPPNPPRGLPALKLPSDIRSPEIPHRLGWLNYWSAAAAQAIGFPDPARDADLLSRSRRTTAGGWVVRLTDEPLELDDPAHLQALLRAYERFPAIGGRAPP